MTDAAASPSAPCPRCQKPAALCVCDTVTPVANKLTALILQHPQEQDVELGTARLAALHLKNAVFKIGLSWASLAKVLGRPADPKRWAVLYLGSADAAKLAPGRELVVLNKKGGALPDQDAALRDLKDTLEGVIVLDGTWSQAKALWWRNAWMLKCRRVILGPRKPSRYGALRREPRRDSLSTIEATGLLLNHLEGRPDIETTLTAGFETMLKRYRETKQTS